MLDNMILILIAVGVVLVALLTIGLIVKRLYRRASKEISFVRTGFGGQRVVMNGGSLVFPVLHEVIPVNMNTVRLEVRRADAAALITKDRMRVDVLAEFYVRVQPTAGAIADAAQTLGKRTMAPEALKELVEGKFVDALRAVAAEMRMEELHEQRVAFVQKVQTAVSEDLLKNGLELESVSLTGLDQTNREYFNPENVFDAAGLTRLTEEIEDRRKIRNDIEQDTQVAVAAKNLEAERSKLEISRDMEYAKLDQQREVAVRRAEQVAEIAREEAVRKREAEEARITADQKVKQAEIGSEQAVTEQRIAMEQQLRDREIGKEKAIETTDIERRKSVELSEQDRTIAVAQKSKEQSEAEAEANKARALAVKASEQVTTVRETEVAERAKVVELVEARQAAERQAIAVVVAAEAEKQAAEDHAEAVRTLADGEAEKDRIGAAGEADAEKLRAAAAEIRYAIEAAGNLALNSAANTLSPEQIALRVKLALIEGLPGIIAESVKPMERIDGIKIFQVEGLAGGGGTNDAAAANGAAGGNLADQVVNSALRYRGQAPLLDALMKELGLAGGDLNQLTATLNPSAEHDSADHHDAEDADPV